MPRAGSSARGAAATKAATTSSSETANLASLELQKTIHKFATVQEEFVKVANNLSQFSSESLFALDAEIVSRKRNLQDLDEETNARKKRRMIDVDNDILKYKRDACVKYLEEHGEVAINRKELEDLRTVKQRAEEDAEKRVAREKEKSKRAVSEAIKSNNMEHKAHVAELTATVKQQQKEIASLQNMNDTLKDEVEKQRMLTRSVAEAARAAPISQTIGGSK